MKYIVYCLVAILAYKSLELYMGYRFLTQLGNCGDAATIAEMKKASTPDDVRRRYLQQSFECVKAQQNFLDSIFNKVKPDEWVRQK
ncbi:MAG: hypothetical protein JO142_20065 [Burkholderiales bacterium]|nr:hypothetical protein [Burkholderiales bacterium]